MSTTTAVRLTDGWHDVTDGTLTIGGEPFDPDGAEGWSNRARVRFHEPDPEGGEGAWIVTVAVDVLAFRTRAGADTPAR